MPHQTVASERIQFPFKLLQSLSATQIICNYYIKLPLKMKREMYLPLTLIMCINSQVVGVEADCLILSLSFYPGYYDFSHDFGFYLLV